MKEKIRVFLVHCLFFILSIWPFGIGFGVIIASVTYCRIEDCSGYNEEWILYFWIIGTLLLNILFFYYYKSKYREKIKKN